MKWPLLFVDKDEHTFVSENYINLLFFNYYWLEMHIWGGGQHNNPFIYKIKS